MSKSSKILIVVTAIISLSASASVMADSIHDALKERLISKPAETTTTGFRREFSPWSIQDYVERSRNAYEANKSGNSEAIAEMDEVSAEGWRKALGNPVKI